MVDRVLDARGLKCPLPILKASKELAGMRTGEVLEVQSSDPVSALDFAAFCAKHGHELSERREQAGVFYIVLIKGG